MKKHICTFIILLFCFTYSVGQSHHRTSYDVAVIGGGTSGICAAVQCARMGTNTLLVESGPWLGGMLTSAGVSAIDGNYRLRGGLWGEFLKDLTSHYGSLDALKTGWVSNVQFEPSVGNNIFQRWAHSTQHLTTMLNTKVDKIVRLRDGWVLDLLHGDKHRSVKVCYLIDATELGDVAFTVGIPYKIGMDAASTTNEKQAPATANNIVQDLTYVVTVKEYNTPHLIARPEGYNPQEFCNSCECKYNIDSLKYQKPWSPQMMLSYGKLPNHKYMLNWPIFGNDTYQNDINVTPAQRDSLHVIAKAKSIRYLYFMQHELGMTNIGIADDEYPTPDHLPIIPYYREGRRFEGQIRFSLNDILYPYRTDRPLYRTAIAVGDYPIDHHHHEYKGDEVKCESKLPSIPSFGLPLGVLIPQKETRLILAEKAISVTHLANGTTRLQPVSMQIGQAAGTLAALAIQMHVTPARVPVRRVQIQLLNSGGYLLPLLDVAPTDTCFKSLQSMAVTGLLKTVSIHKDWQNETWIQADSLLTTADLRTACDMYQTKATIVKADYATAKKVILACAHSENPGAVKKSKDTDNTFSKIMRKFGLKVPQNEEMITRKQWAVLFDQYLYPLENKNVDLNGNYINK